MQAPLPVLSARFERALQAHVALARRGEPRPVADPDECAAETRLDLLEAIMRELPHGAEPERFVVGRPGRARSGPVEDTGA